MTPAAALPRPVGARDDEPISPELVLVDPALALDRAGAPATALRPAAFLSTGLTRPVLDVVPLPHVRQPLPVRSLASPPVPQPSAPPPTPVALAPTEPILRVAAAAPAASPAPALASTPVPDPARAGAAARPARRAARHAPAPGKSRRVRQALTWSATAAVATAFLLDIPPTLLVERPTFEQADARTIPPVPGSVLGSSARPAAPTAADAIGPVAFSWPEAPGAVGYRFELSRSGAIVYDARTVETRIDVPGTWLAGGITYQLEPGDYDWRVLAQDADGSERPTPVAGSSLTLR